MRKIIFKIVIISVVLLAAIQLGYAQRDSRNRQRSIARFSRSERLDSVEWPVPGPAGTTIPTVPFRMSATTTCDAGALGARAAACGTCMNIHIPTCPDCCMVVAPDIPAGTNPAEFFKVLKCTADEDARYDCNDSERAFDCTASDMTSADLTAQVDCGYLVTSPDTPIPIPGAQERGCPAADGMEPNVSGGQQCIENAPGIWYCKNNPVPKETGCSARITSAQGVTPVTFMSIPDVNGSYPGTTPWDSYDPVNVDYFVIENQTNCDVPNFNPSGGGGSGGGGSGGSGGGGSGGGGSGGSGGGGSGGGGSGGGNAACFKYEEPSWFANYAASCNNYVTEYETCMKDVECCSENVCCPAGNLNCCDPAALTPAEFQACTGRFQNSCSQGTCEARSLNSVTSWDAAVGTIVDTSGQHYCCGELGFGENEISSANTADCSVFSIDGALCTQLNRELAQCLSGVLVAQQTCTGCFNEIDTNFFYEFVPKSNESMIIYWDILSTPRPGIPMGTAFFYTRAVIVRVDDGVESLPLTNTDTMIHQKDFSNAFSILAASPINVGLLTPGDIYRVKIRYYIPDILVGGTSLFMDVDSMNIRIIRVRR